MRYFITVLSLIISMVSYGQEFKFNYQSDFSRILNRTMDQTDSLNYDKLLNRYRLNDRSLTDFEILALLIGFTNNQNFKPYSYLLGIVLIMISFWHSYVELDRRLGIMGMLKNKFKR